MKLNIIIELLLFSFLAVSCERLKDSSILNGEMTLNSRKLQLNRGSVQYSEVVKTLSDGTKQQMYSFYRLNVSPNSTEENKATFIITAYDRLKNNIGKFSKDDIEMRLVRSFENQIPNFRIYENVVDAKFEIKNISKRNIIEGTFSCKIVSNDKSFIKLDTLIIENGVFNSKLETFETSYF